MRDDPSAGYASAQVDEYETRAEAELKTARAASDHASQTAHLNEAARYAVLSEARRRKTGLRT